MEAGIAGNKLWGMLAQSHMPCRGTNSLTTPNNDFQPPWNSETLSLSAWLSSLDVTVSTPALTWKTLYSIDSFLFLMNVNEHDFYCKHFIASLETTCNTLAKRNTFLLLLFCFVFNKPERFCSYYSSVVSRWALQQQSYEMAESSCNLSLGQWERERILRSSTHTFFKRIPRHLLISFQ